MKTPAGLVRTTVFIPSIGNLDRRIRPQRLSMEKPAYDAAAAGDRKFFALPDRDWRWAFNVPDFDLRLIPVDMSHPRDFGTPEQSCHPIGRDSEQIKEYEETMRATKSGFVITLCGETSGAVRRHADGHWQPLLQWGSITVLGECCHTEQNEFDGFKTYNASVRGATPRGHLIFEKSTGRR